MSLEYQYLFDRLHANVDNLKEFLSKVKCTNIVQYLEDRANTTVTVTEDWQVEILGEHYGISDKIQEHILSENIFSSVG